MGQLIISIFTDTVIHTHLLVPFKGGGGEERGQKELDFKVLSVIQGCLKKNILKKNTLRNE